MERYADGFSLSTYYIYAAGFFCYEREKIGGARRWDEGAISFHRLVEANEQNERRPTYETLGVEMPHLFLTCMIDDKKGKDPSMQVKYPINA